MVPFYESCNGTLACVLITTDSPRVFVAQQQDIIDKVVQSFRKRRIYDFKMHCEIVYLHTSFDDTVAKL